MNKIICVDVLNWALVMAIPGPDIVAIGTRAARYGRCSGIAVAFGAATGVAIWSALSLVGVSALLSAVPVLSTVLPVVGCLVLIVLGIRALHGAIAAPVRTVDSGASAAKDSRRVRAWEPGPSVWSSLRLGLITNLANPKALVFFTSIFTPMMAHYPSAAEKAGMLAVLVAVTVAVFSSIAVGLHAMASTRLSRLPGLRFAPGLVFVGIGVAYLVELG